MTPPVARPGRFSRLRSRGTTYVTNTRTSVGRWGFKGWLIFIVLFVVLALLYFDFVVELVNLYASSAWQVPMHLTTFVLSLIVAWSFSSWAADRVSS